MPSLFFFFFSGFAEVSFDFGLNSSLKGEELAFLYFIFFRVKA